MKLISWFHAAVLVGATTAGVTVWAMNTFEMKSEVSIRRQLFIDRLDRMENKIDRVIETINKR